MFRVFMPLCHHADSVIYVNNVGYAHYVKKSIAYSYLDEAIWKSNEKFQVENNADFLAVISGIYGSSNVENNVLAYKKLFCPSLK